MIKSYLFVPGDRPDRVEKALSSKANAIIIDLEDAVSESEKGRVRDMVCEILASHDFSNPKQVCVRINDSSTSFYEDDVKMVSKYPVVTIMLPKTNSAQDVQALENTISSNQFIIPLVETALGVIHAYEIATAGKQVTKLAFGAVDYCLDLNISISEHGTELIHPRSALVLASRAAGLEAPIDTVYTDISNDEGLINEILRAKNLGMLSKMCIHPAQLEHVNTFFAPSDEEINWAKKVVAGFEDALKNGLSAIKIDDQMIDVPVYNQALILLNKLQ